MVEIFKNWILFLYFLRNWIRFPDLGSESREMLMLSFEITACRIWRKYQITFSTSQVPRSKANVRPIISQCPYRHQKAWWPEVSHDIPKLIMQIFFDCINSMLLFFVGWFHTISLNYAFLTVTVFLTNSSVHKQLHHLQ